MSPSLYRVPEIGLVCRVQKRPTERTQTSPVMSTSAHSQASTAISWPDRNRENEWKRNAGTYISCRERVLKMCFLFNTGKLAQSEENIWDNWSNPGGARVIFQAWQNTLAKCIVYSVTIECFWEVNTDILVHICFRNSMYLLCILLQTLYLHTQSVYEIYCSSLFLFLFLELFLECMLLSAYREAEDNYTKLNNHSDFRVN